VALGEEQPAQHQALACGPQADLAQALANVVEGATRHGGAGGTVEHGAQVDVAGCAAITHRPLLVRHDTPSDTNTHLPETATESSLLIMFRQVKRGTAAFWHRY